MYPNLPDTSIHHLGLYVFASLHVVNLTLQKVDTLSSFFNFFHYFWLVVQQAHGFGASGE
jgi:hypothetical protein